MQHSSSQRGGTIVGFIIGLVVGLVIAVVVALIITKAPIPFVNKLGHADKTDTEATSSALPDPNKTLYSKEGVAEATPSSAPVLTNLPAPGSSPSNPIPAPTPAATPPAPPATAAASAVAEGKPALLQAGAYTSSDAAENMKAKLALLGFEANVSMTTRDGASVYRVRLGPYDHIDDLNRVRSRLAENGIDAGIVPASR